MPTAPIPWETSRRIKRREYEKMVAAGVFGDERVELLYGVIVEMAPKGPPHDSAIQRLTKRRLAADCSLAISTEGRRHSSTQSAVCPSNGS